MMASMSLPVGESSACSVMEVTRMPRLRSMALKATACSRLRVKRENFQTRIAGNAGVKGDGSDGLGGLQGGHLLLFTLVVESD